MAFDFNSTLETLNKAIAELVKASRALEEERDIAADSGTSDRPTHLRDVLPRASASAQDKEVQSLPADRTPVANDPKASKNT